MMRGRTFLDVARELVAGGSEAHWRAAAGRSYYALMIEGRDALRRWGFAPAPRDPVHSFVRFRFLYALDADLKEVGRALAWLGTLRNRADYETAVPGPFGNSAAAHQSIREAEQALSQLDGIEADSARLTTAIAGIRARWP